MALDLGLYSTGHPARVSIHTAGGTVQADSVVLDSLRIAGAEVRNSHAFIHDLPDLPLAVDGLLGLSFLGAYQVTLDTTRGELVLRASQAKMGKHLSAQRRTRLNGGRTLIVPLSKPEEDIS